MDKKNNSSKIVVRIFYIFLLIFMVLYFSKQSGYYEFATHKQVELTEKQMKKFEKDVSNGQNINLKDYTQDKEITYNNFVSDIGYDLSNQISNIVTIGIDSTFNFLGQLFSN